MTRHLILPLTLLCLPFAAQATIINVSSGDTLVGNRGSNLVVNGSFEADDGIAANGSYWATGTTLTPGMSLTGWNASGQADSYASWGNDGAGRIVGSELIPDGRDALYFGALIQGAPSTPPIYHADGQVTFASTPTFTPKPNYGPVTLSQTISGLSTSQSYTLDFWVSGEDAGIGGQFGNDGFFGFDITGESRMYFAAPYGGSGLGTSQRYYVQFVPNSTSVALTWTNWGHYSTANGLSTEIVLDDVILNADTVPEPCSLAALSLAGLGALSRRRASLRR